MLNGTRFRVRKFDLKPWKASVKQPNVELKCRQTMKRKNSKKTRSTGSETVCYLREKSEAEVKLKEQKLELQKRRLELDAAKLQSDQNFDNLIMLMDNQMNQNHQVTLTMLERFTNHGPDSNRLDNDGQ